MAKLLIIETEGMRVEISGIPFFRTPATVDISKLDENLVIEQLNNQGIDKYKIIK